MDKNARTGLGCLIFVILFFVIAYAILNHQYNKLYEQRLENDPCSHGKSLFKDNASWKVNC